METKICFSCKIEKSTEQFFKRKDSPDGFRSDCKQCSTERAKDWRKNHPERTKEVAAESRKRHRTKRNFAGADGGQPLLT